MPDLGFIAFLRVFGESWLTKMSGPLTVPFTIAALIAPNSYRALFAVLAVVCGVFSYHVWRNARGRQKRRDEVNSDHDHAASGRLKAYAHVVRSGPPNRTGYTASAASFPAWMNWRTRRINLRLDVARVPTRSARL
jgi:hypothetical protein